MGCIANRARWLDAIFELNMRNTSADHYPTVTIGFDQINLLLIVSMGDHLDAMTPIRTLLAVGQKYMLNNLVYRTTLYPGRIAPYSRSVAAHDQWEKSGDSWFR